MSRHESRPAPENEAFGKPIVTVRMSREEREQLRSEATASNLSMQALCRRKLGLPPEPKSRMHRYGKGKNAQEQEQQPGSGDGAAPAGTETGA